MNRIASGLAVVALGLAGPTGAEEDVVPGCYLRTGIGIPAPAADRALFVLVDQTTPVPAELGAMVRTEAARNVLPGTRFAVASFSAAEGGQFVRVTTTGTVERPVAASQRNTLSVPRLRNLDQCLAMQRSYAVGKVGAAIGRASPPAGARFAHSEIMRALSDLSRRVAATPARDRIVLIYSDMIEHSDRTSFYQGRQLRTIDPRAELALAAGQGLVGNFAGARVYVIGGGLSETGAARASRGRDALRAFWTAWFRQSRARLVEFGAPALVNEVR